MSRDWHAFWAVPLAAGLLLWPAMWNGYPIIFADTGTYLSQAVHRYIGWDRPPFYSLFMLPLHLTLTTWPVIVVQALLTVLVLRMVCRALLPSLATRWLPLVVLPLTIGTWLPFPVCQLMPDFFTPLLVLLLCVRDPAARPRRLGWCGTLAAFMIATQQSSLLLALLLAPFTRRVTPILLAMAALLAVNLVGHGRFALSPFGNVFLLARVIYDGPGMAVLRRDCPVMGWRLCPMLDRFPPTSDEFLWLPDSPIIAAGGHKAVSAEADAIILAALRAEPGMELRAFFINAAEQFVNFHSGDGLESWPIQVTPWIIRDFPVAEQARYAQARQTRGMLEVPGALAGLHAVVGVAGVAACAILLPMTWRRRPVAARFLLITLLTLPISAAITGGLSTPHDRYQSRIMWLPPFIAALSLVSLRRSG